MARQNQILASTVAVERRCAVAGLRRYHYNHRCTPENPEIRAVDPTPAWLTGWPMRSSVFHRSLAQFFNLFGTLQDADFPRGFVLWRRGYLLGVPQKISNFGTVHSVRTEVAD